MEAAQAGVGQGVVGGSAGDADAHPRQSAAPSRLRQLGLFDAPAEQAETVARLKREVNAEMGRFALRSGATLPLVEVYRDEAQILRYLRCPREDLFLNIGDLRLAATRRGARTRSPSGRG